MAIKMNNGFFILWSYERGKVERQSFAALLLKKHFPLDCADAGRPVRCRVKGDLYGGFIAWLNRGLNAWNETVSWHAERAFSLPLIREFCRCAHAGSRQPCRGYRNSICVFDFIISFF